MVSNDRVDEMVEPAQDHCNVEQAQGLGQDEDQEQEQEHESDSSDNDNDDKPPHKTCAVDAPLTNGAAALAKQEDDRVSSTSLYCSLPLSRDVQSIIDTFPKTPDPERKKTRKLPCLYCERTFVADGLRQKHVERCHSVKQARRSSSRFQQGAVASAAAAGPATALQCQFCDAFQPPAGDDDLSDLFRHLVGEHADRYFACVACRERFVLRTHLDEHREEEHGIKREQDAASAGSCKGTPRDIKDEPDSASEEKVIFEQKELRSKKTPIKSTKLGTKRSARLQNKETPSPQLNKHSSASSTTSSSSSTSSKKKGKTRDVLLDAAERESMKVATHENPYPTFDAFYRVKKITDHSIDNLRITSLTFNDVFDQAFYTRIKCNIADNLQNHIDGKLFKNEESESRISNFEKAQGQTEMNLAENHYGCEISLHAATPVASFLAPQLGDDPETQIEYGSKASKKKTKPDEVHYKYFTRRKYQASIQEIKENRDLSKLDMWTQYVVKNRQQTVANTTRSEKEKQDYKRGDEYRAKLQNEELNRILDRRGPFEDLKLEANKQAVLDGSVLREARVEASCILEEVLLRVFELTQPKVCAAGGKTELTDAEIPGYLNLRRASAVEDAHVDRSDKITLICSSEETENFEAPQVSPRDKHALVELSGEWTRSRLFICAACGTRLANMRALIDHKNGVHQNVWCQHYEFVGKQGAYYRHLSIPGLGKMQLVEGTPAVKSWLRSTARQCTKCKKLCNTLGELHRHILECGEDWSWMLIRKKCKYRPYGAKTRRKRRGLIKRHDTSKKENKEKKTYKRTDRPREKPSDAETIQRMLANLPAKRATRKEMSLKDGFPRANKKVDPKNAKGKKLPKSRAEQLLQDTATLVKRKVLVANKCNPVGNVRKSVRNLNKVISSSLIDNNIVVRRKYKALQAQRATRARAAIATADLPERPVDLTEEQRAEEVKKKISLFKKVQKFRQSVIKKRTTKASTSSADSVERLAPVAGTSASVEDADTWRKTRSASILTDNSSGSDKPSKKKMRTSFGAKLLRTLSMRRRNKRDEDASSSSAATSTGVPEEKRKRFASIKKVVKKFKVNQNKKSDKTDNTDKTDETEAVQNEGAEVEGAPTSEHFLEESIHASTTRTISDSPELDKRDNDNRPSAIAPPLNSTSDKHDELEALDANSDKADATPCAPIITITVADKDIDTQDNAPPSVPLITTVKALTEITETLSVSISASTATACGQLTSPPIQPSLSPLLGRSKSKLCKRAKGLNDCIAMLTSKLQCKSDLHTPTANVKDAETPVVVVTPHDTTTEEQNVVIPEDMVSENLESAKEPEAAPPSPVPTKTTPSDAAQTAITISDLSTPVIEQDKENIELEQKSLLPAHKHVYDATLEKVVDLIKCFEDMRPKEIRNGHLDHSKAEVINGLKGLTTGLKKTAARKIGSNRKAPSKRAERTFVQEPLNISRLEEDLILNDFERKIGAKRSLPQRKTKKTFVDLKIPKIKLKNRNPHQPKSEATSNLSTILEESQLQLQLLDDFPPHQPQPFVTEKSALSISQVLADAPQTPALVHSVHNIQANQLPTRIADEKDELPVDLSLTRKADIAIEDVPVDLSTKKNVCDLVVLLSPRKEDFTMEVAEKPLEVPLVAEPTGSCNLQANIQSPLENEAIILENKAIPHPSPPSPKADSLSESEDELPLAALLKTKITESVQTTTSTATKKVERDRKTNAAIVSPERAKSEIQAAFLMKVKKANIANKSTSMRKRKSEIASLHTYFNPILDAIVISDEESILESTAVPLKTTQPINQENSTVLTPISQVAHTLKPKENVLPPVESVVCTPDLGIPNEDVLVQKQSLQAIMSSQIIEAIDFEDVIPVVSISPSEAVKYKRNRNTTKTKGDDLNSNEKLGDEFVAAVNEIGVTPVRAKRGRKPKTKESVGEDLHCKPKHIDSAVVVEEISIQNITTLPEEIEARQTENEDKLVVNDQPQIDDVPVTQEFKGVTLKTRKVGRPKLKRGRKPKVNKSIAQEPETVEDNVLKSPDVDVNVSVDQVTDRTESLDASLQQPEALLTIPTENNRLENKISEKDETAALLDEPAELLKESANNPDTTGELAQSPREKKSKSKGTKGRKGRKSASAIDREVDKPEADLDLGEVNEVIPVETQTSALFTEQTPPGNVDDILTPEKDDAIDEQLQSTPRKTNKSKRGRKPRAKVAKVAPTAIDVEVGPETVLEHEELSPILLTPENVKTRSRKRKSDEPIQQVDEENVISSAPSQGQVEEAKKTIAIYDFDEDDDECTGDNSKENMEHLKSKSTKRSRRNGHSPSKIQLFDADDSKVKSLVKDCEDKIPDEINTPLKDVQNESFIQTPDLNDSALATKIANRFKVKKGKNSKAKKIPIENIQEHYCDICNKQFGRLDSLNKHKRTLTHIAKLSEIEAFEAEAKKKLSELQEEEKEEPPVSTELVCPVEENIPPRLSPPPIPPPSPLPPPPPLVDTKPDVNDVKTDVEVDAKPQEHEFNVLSPTSEFMRARSHSDSAKTMMITSPFSLKTNNDSLRLADIISDVLNKPVDGMDDYRDVDKQTNSPLEPKRYKSLGERKSFDSDSVAYTTPPTYNISPASTLMNKTSSDEFLKKQLSLLENIIGENNAAFDYVDEASVQSIGSEKSGCPSDMSLVSDIKADSSRIISFNDESNFVKPSTQYEEISEDSMNNRTYDQERSRKTLNRDEELFLECCSLLKSSSEVSDSKKSRAQEVPVSDYNAKNRSNEANVRNLGSRKLVINEDDFMSDSCPNTPIGDTYDDFSNSDTIKTDWSAKMNDKGYEDISQSSAPPEESSFKAFNFKLDSKSDIDESSNSVDFRKNINAKFVGLMAEAMKGKSPRRKKPKERRKSDTTQTSITDYVQLTPKSSSNSADNSTDLTNDSKKVMTKGAMKIFEGLKVSIPTDEIDMNQVLDCSPTSKRLEIEESTKLIGKTKGLNFGNKLGLKVTKKRVARSRKPDEYLGECDKIPDVYDFEETQDNTDLFSPTSKLNFRNGSKLALDDEQESKEVKPTKKAKLTNEDIESESESNNQDLDLFGAEIQSVNSFSTETESSTSIKPPSVTTTQENITKKKCQIMGRIFKNAFKAKTDGTKENTPVDDGDALEKYIIGGPIEELATPPPEKSPVPKERPKMSEKEMDLLFDKLLMGKDEHNAKLATNDSTPVVSPLEETTKEAKCLDKELDKELKDTKESKGKKGTPKSVKANRRRSRKHSESSDDEFNFTKSPKKRQIRKSKPRDNGINLDEEIKECMGVAGRKSQRKCTSGKQNVLIEYWSSDDSEFEAMLRLSMQESGAAEKPKDRDKSQGKSTGAEVKTVVTEEEEATFDANSKPVEVEEVFRQPPTQQKEHAEDSPRDPPENTPPPPKNKTKRCSTNPRSRNDSRDNKTPRTPKAKHSRAPQDEETLAANRRKRAAVDTLYYWSSSSEDDTQNMIEVKSVRDEIDDEEDRPQHGWIVGDSPKKLVTLLAHAKGKKTNR